MTELEQISAILDTGLERDALAIIKALCEEGVNPQALAQVVKFLRREAAAAPAQSSS